MKARHSRSIFSDDIKIVPNANDANPNAARGAGNPIEYKEGQIVFLKDRQNQGKVTHVDEKTGLVTVLTSMLILVNQLENNLLLTTWSFKAY